MQATAYHPGTARVSIRKDTPLCRFGTVRPGGDSKLDVPVRTQCAVAVNRIVSLGVVSYSEWTV